MNFQSIDELFQKASDRGYRWAHSRAATSMSPADKEFLENDALMLTAHLNAAPFDPEANPEDALAQRRYEQLGLDKDDADMALAKAKVETRKCEQELAQHVVSEQPATSTVVTICGTALFAAGCAVGLYDWVRDRISDPVLSGMLALAFGVALGSVVVTAIYNVNSPKRRTWGLIAGLGLSLSAGFLRYAFSGGGLLTAVALTLFELAIVATLDWLGRHLNDQFEIWRGEDNERVRRQQRLDAAERHETRAADKLRELDGQIEAHQEKVAARSTCAKKFPEIQEAVKKAEVVGAQRAIAENIGIKRGVIPINSAKELTA
jgi:hypothetical protein